MREEEEEEEDDEDEDRDGDEEMNRKYEICEGMDGRSGILDGWTKREEG